MAPAHLSPDNGASSISTSPTFQWQTVSGATKYGLYISQPPYGAANLVYQNESLTGASLVLPSGILNEGVTYRWNMRAGNNVGWGPFSSAWSFTTVLPLQPPTEAPPHISPSNGDLDISPTPTFQWSSVSGADYYGLYISEPPYGEANLVYDSEEDYGPIYGTSFPLPSGILREGVTYHWNMSAWNEAGRGPFSSAWSFTTGTTLLLPPNLSSPDNGAPNVSITPTFNWSSVSGANRYWIMVATSQSALPTDPYATSAPGCIVSDYTSATSYQPPTPLAEGVTYYWQVQAYNTTTSPITQGEYSSQWSFTILADDVYWLAKAIMSEASIGTREEQIAVGWTVLNRLYSGNYGSSMEQVVKRGYVYNQEPTSAIITLADDLLKGNLGDLTDGATHFFSPISMPWEGDEGKYISRLNAHFDNFDTDGGLHEVPGTSQKVYFPSWAKPKEGWTVTDFYQTVESLEWVSGLENVRNWYFMFYRSISSEYEISVGDWIQIIDDLNVRDDHYIASNTIIWTAPAGSVGIVIEGPESGSGYTWWKIRYDYSSQAALNPKTGKDVWPSVIGWSAHTARLQKTSPPSQPPKFLTLPFTESAIMIQQGWVYTWTPDDPNAHKGIDYIKGAWQPFDVVAAADGWAMWSEQPGDTGVYGKFVLIQHAETDYKGSRYFTLYAHLDSIASGIPYQDRSNIDYDTSKSLKWKHVRTGDVIGRAGNTGASNTGIHLHFEVQRKAYAHYKTDPYDLYNTRLFYPGDGSYTNSGSRYIWTTDPPSLSPNNPPAPPTNLGQFKADGATAISEGGSTSESTVVFKGTVSDPDGDKVKLEIELRETTEAFTGTPTLETIGEFVTSGSEVTITRYGLVSADYHWQARAVDERGEPSPWVEFGTAGNADFTVAGEQDQNTWLAITQTPEGIFGGGGVIFHEGKLYVIAGGGSTSFWSYDLGSKSWITLQSLPEGVEHGSDMAFDGQRYIYITKGSTWAGLVGTREFWRYDLDHNLWEDLPDTPEDVGSFGSVCYADGFVYLRPGTSLSGAFYRYSINSQTWETRAVGPILAIAAGPNASMAYDGTRYVYAFQGGQGVAPGDILYDDIWRYDTSLDEWSELGHREELDRADLVFAAGGLYALNAYTAYNFEFFDLATNRWVRKTDVPTGLGFWNSIGGGSSLAYDGAGYIYALNGNGSSRVWRYKGVPGGPPSVGEGAPNQQLFIDCYNRIGGKATLGYPINEAHRWGNGYIQDFRGGEGYEGAIMQPDGASSAYAVYGSIWSRYLTLGGAEGPLGYPATDETEGKPSSITSARCRYNKFDGGAIAHRKATDGYESKTVFLGWGIFNKWEYLNHGQGVLGLPTSDEGEASQSGVDGFDTTGVICDFEGGHIHWHRTGTFANQAFETHGEIDNEYMQMGGSGSWLGFPVTDEYTNASGYPQSDFEGGYITTTDGINYEAFQHDTAPPTVSSISIKPDAVTLGDTFTISYTVSDTGGSGLNRVELWRRSETVDWQEVTRNSLEGAGNGPYSGTFSDTPPSAGTYWYGIHVVDNAGNWAPEDSPVSVSVTTPNTGAGNNVTVSLPDEGVDVTFSQVTVPGQTTVTASDAGPEVPSGFLLAGQYYDITTTADCNGPITVCIHYNPASISGPESSLRLFHYDGAAWQDVTTFLDTDNNVIWGEVSSLSVFTVVESLDLTPPGVDNPSPTDGSYISNLQPQITITLSDEGTGVDPASIIFNVNGVNYGIDAPELNYEGTILTFNPPAAYLDGQAINLVLDAADNAGNSMATYSWSFTIDLTPPDAPAVTGTSPTNNTTPTWSWNIPDEAVDIRYQLDSELGEWTYVGGTTVTEYTPETALSEGIHTLYVQASDSASNWSVSGSYSITIDITPPTVTATPDRTANANGWYNADVTVTFTATDTLSGVDPASITAPITLSDEAAGQSATGYATDLAGNTGSATLTGINIDKTPPTISGAPTTSPNVNGWYNTDVTIHFEASDDLSGLDTVTPDTTLTADGADQSVTGTATDLAGNSASTTVSGINIDKIPPTVTATPDRANANGWYSDNVTVTFTATDPLSGVDPASITAPITLSDEAADQSATGYATDLAGNTGSATLTGINIDKTPPTISGAPTTSPNANGWYNTDVTVHFDASDDLSGLDTVTPDTTLTADGADQSVTGVATDLAGNSASTTVSGINIDKTPPTVTATPDRTANANGWYNADVTVTFTATDPLSGVDPASITAPITLSNEAADQSATGYATDLAGNTGSATLTGINIDKTPPTISGSRTPPPNVNGWNNTDVTVQFTASDALSGIASVTPDTVVTTEGANQSVTGTATDKAGNSATYTVSGINIDKTPPSITVNSPQPRDYFTSESLTIDFSANDALSGITSIVTTLDGSPVTSGQVFNLATMAGSHTLVVSATDKAGNANSTTVSFYVVIAVTADIDPNTLNLQSKGNWITAYIEMPAGYDVMNIDGSTILLNGTVPAYLGKEGWAKAEANSSNIMDHDGDGIPERMVKFDRSQVQAMLSPAPEVEMTVTGEVAGVRFEGMDIIRVIDEGKGSSSPGKGKK